MLLTVIASIAFEQLWEKEGLLEYQEERLMNSEDLELEMANYINEMAVKGVLCEAINLGHSTTSCWSRLSLYMNRKHFKRTTSRCQLALKTNRIMGPSFQL